MTQTPTVELLGDLHEMVRQAAAQKAREEQEAIDTRLRAWANAVEGIFGPEMLTALDVRYEIRGDFAVALFSYLGQTYPVGNQPGVLDEEAYRAGLSQWLQRLDLEAAAKQRELAHDLAHIAEILQAKPLPDCVTPEWFAKWQRTCWNKYAYLLDNDAEIDDMMRDALVVYGARENVRRDADKEYVAEIVGDIEMAGAAVHVEELASDLSVGLAPAFVAVIQEAASRRIKALEREALEIQERNKARLRAAQRGAFYPFLYYRVYYQAGFDDTGSPILDCFASYLCAPKGVWWEATDGTRTRLSHVVRVDEVTVETERDWPLALCDWVETDQGAYRVPPGMAGVPALTQ